jgi:DNA-binding response OmpR family regulator
MAKILLVEDDTALVEMIVQALQREDLTVDHLQDGIEALGRLLSGAYSLAILDWQVPGMTGIEICSTLREQGSTMPVLILTARRDPTDLEKGLYTGADDYLIKPVAVRELCMRVKALLRRPQTLHGNELRCGDLLVCLKTARVSRGNEIIELMPAEYAVLEFLMRHHDMAFSVEDLLTHVWKADSDVTLAAVTSCIKRLRDKIDAEERNSIIKTVHGVGYMIEAQ